jgi:chemotaxis response regulator CheB
MQQHRIPHYVGIGASAGGLPALCEFFDHLPADTNAAFFIVTHLYSNYPSRLNDIIQQHTRMSVLRVSGDMEIRPNTVYILIENTVMTIDDQRVTTRKRGPSEIINRAIDIFLTSLALNYKEKALGIVLSGTGKDGTAGAIRIKENGGNVLVQDPGSTEFNSMPGSVINHDHPLAIKRPSDLANALIQLTKPEKRNA